MSRGSRKDEHLHYVMQYQVKDADFSDCRLVYQGLPEIDYNQVDISTSLGGIRLEVPFFINAITGGTDKTGKVNRALAEAARLSGLAMAVGSQMAALEDREMERTFQVVREVNPGGVIFANIGAYATPDMARRAVEMVQAQALQVHLNIPQELMMPEGDRDFRGYLDNLTGIARELQVPVIVKEVGFGLSRETALQLISRGIKIMDVGGRGGTNFIQVEADRKGIYLEEEMQSWGIPTLTSLLETLDAAGEGCQVIASGGINNAFSLAKALSLGARAVGMAGLPVKIILERGKEAFQDWVAGLSHSLKQLMTMVGAPGLEELRKKPVVITGNTSQWMERRGIGVNHLARR